MSLTAKLTDAGRGLLIRALSGETINFTRLKIGSGGVAVEPSEGDYWLDTANNLLYRYNIGWVDYTIATGNDLYHTPTAPSNPTQGMVWYSTTTEQLRECTFAWTAAVFPAGTVLTHSATAPEDPSDGDLWIDTANGWIYDYDDQHTEWVKGAHIYIGNRNYYYQKSAPPNPSLGDLWFNTATERMYEYTVDWVLSRSRYFEGETAPAAPFEGDIWYNPEEQSIYSRPKRWTALWTPSQDTVTVSADAPSEAAAGDLWFDTEAAVLYQYNGAAWAESTSAFSRGANAPSMADDLTDIVTPEMSLSISEMKRGTDSVSLTAYFDSSEISRQFHWTETGVFAEGTNGAEVLYAYLYSGEDYDTIPANNIGRTLSTTLTVIVAVDDAENITAVISEGANFATKEQLDAHAGDYNNPHRVTKAQVGLGNVPNLAPADFVPEYETPGSIEAPVSGEKLSLFMGKVRRAILNLMSHLTANNPHGITPAKIGAAAAKHTHSKEDITDLLSEATTASGMPDKVGFFQGNGTNVTIRLDFSPGRVVIIPMNIWTKRDVRGIYHFARGANIYHSSCGDTYSYDTTNLLGRGHGCAYVTTNGFVVQHHASYLPDLNASGVMYMYLAWK